MAHERILIVEDEAVVAMEIEARLLKLGYVIAGVVASGEAAIAEAGRSAPALALMDIMLAGELDGIRTAEILGVNFNVPVVFLTAYSDDKTLERAKKTGPYGYLLKPFEAIDLRTAIEVALYKHAIEQKLRESEQRYRTLAEAAQDHIFITNPDHTIQYMNSLAAANVGRPPDEIVGRALDELFPPHAADRMKNTMDAVLRSGEAMSLEEKLPFPGGEIWLSTILTPLKNDRGAATGVMGISRDITRRKQAEEALSRTNRALRTLSKCNEALVRATSEKEFLRESCEAIVNEAGYRLAWVGYAENDETKTVRPVQQCGYEDNYLETVKICWANTEYGRGPTGTAIRTGKHFVVQNVQTDPRFSLWKDEAVKRGYASIIGLPLKTGETAIGALTIYAAEAGAFDADEVKLLAELADDIAFGIVTLRARGAREEAEAQVKRNYDTQAVINEILRISLSDAELPEIFQRTLDLVLAIAWLSFDSRGCIFLAGEGGNELLMSARKNMLDHTAASCLRVPFGRCLCGRAALSKKIVFADRIDERHDIIHDDDVSHGHYCIPILQGDLVLGVINIYTREGHTRKAHDEHFLISVANALAGVIQRKRAEKALQLSTYRLNEAQRIAHVGSWDLDILRNRLSWSEEIYRIFEIDPARFGASYDAFLNLVHADDRQAVNDAYQNSLKNRAPYEIAHRLQLPDHRVKYVLERCETFYDAEGAAIHSIGTVQDITERNRTEQEREHLISELQTVLNIVSRSQQEWQETFDSITDMITIHDEDHTILKANKAFAQCYHTTPQEVVGRKCHEYFHGSDKPMHSCPLAGALCENTPGTHEFTDNRSGRTYFITIFPMIFPGTEKRCIIHIARDITDVRDKELRLIMSERLASLGQMASGIAHEINNPLAAIAGCAEGLLNRVRQNRIDPAFFENYLAIIEEEISRCKAITTSMLSFVRKTEYEQKDVDLHETLNKAVEVVGYQGRLKAVSLEKRFSETLPLVRGSEGELRQAFITLITNALDAMEDSGTLSIETGVREGAVFVMVTDSGSGIAPAVLDKIFDPFFTTKSDKGGTGLGLSIAKKIVATHTGTIDVQSTPGKGTSFTITLPVQ